jgi:hypothetical protein
VLTRRVQVLTVQAADGQVWTLKGNRLPDAIGLYTGKVHDGQNLAEILIAPEKVSVPKVLPTLGMLLIRREAFYLLLGMFVGTALSAVADVITRMLS